MYESPIEIITQAVDTINRKQQDDVYSVVMKYNINVNKDELIKALQYDRGQYKKGYDDGFAYGIKVFAEKLKEYFPSIAGVIDYTVEELLKIERNPTGD
jgi:hypothetical protein